VAEPEHMAPPQLEQWLRQIRARTTGPFDGSDPVVLEELSPEQLGWRAAMFLLAEHGGEVAVPARLTPPVQDLQVAAGFLYAVQLKPRADGHIVLSCRYAADVGASPGADITMDPLELVKDDEK
jgi:hypothetical protein